MVFCSHQFISPCPFVHGIVSQIRSYFRRKGHIVFDRYKNSYRRKILFQKVREITFPIVIGVHRVFLNILLHIGKHQKPKVITYEQAVELHRRFPLGKAIGDAYKYDLESKKERAASRFRQINSLIDIGTVKHVAELGAGDGQLALLFFEEGYRVEIIDIEDWRDDQVKKADIVFHHVKEDNYKYGIPDGYVDLFISYATLEHVSNPTLVLREMIRITRPGGTIYLNFGPLYNSPWGLHAYRTYYAPYPQFMIDDYTMQRFIEKNGIYDLGVKREKFQYVNRWSLSDYQNLIFSMHDRVDVILFKKEPMYYGIKIVYQNLKCFWGRNLSFDELTTHGLEILLHVKRSNEK
jgi:ubiquinone/menaquinone biosynthesis C-methylase UbiE